MSAGAESPVFTRRAHLQAVLLLVRRRPREDRAEEPDAHRRAMDGRLPAVLLRRHVELGVQANRLHAGRGGDAERATRPQAAPRLPLVRVVHEDDRARVAAAAVVGRLLRRGDEPAHGGVLLPARRRLHRHHLLLLLPSRPAEEPVPDRQPPAAEVPRPLRAGRVPHEPAAAGRVRRGVGGRRAVGHAADAAGGGHDHGERAGGGAGPAGALAVRRAGHQRAGGALPRADAAADGVRQDERVPAVALAVQVPFRPQVPLRLNTAWSCVASRMMMVDNPAAIVCAVVEKLWARAFKHAESECDRRCDFFT